MLLKQLGQYAFQGILFKIKVHHFYFFKFIFTVKFDRKILISKIDNWEGRQVYVSGFSTNDRNNGQLQGAYLKIDPFSYCVNTHDKGKFTGDDDASRTFRFILEKSLPRNFQPNLLCARQILTDQVIFLIFYLTPIQFYCS